MVTPFGKDHETSSLNIDDAVSISAEFNASLKASETAIKSEGSIKVLPSGSAFGA